MSTEYARFTATLGLSEPCEAADVQFDADAKRINIELRCVPGCRFACPACGAGDQGVHCTR